MKKLFVSILCSIMCFAYASGETISGYIVFQCKKSDVLKLMKGVRLFDKPTAKYVVICNREGKMYNNLDSLIKRVHNKEIPSLYQYTRNEDAVVVIPHKELANSLELNDSIIRSIDQLRELSQSLPYYEFDPDSGYLFQLIYFEAMVVHAGVDDLGLERIWMIRSDYDIPKTAELLVLSNITFFSTEVHSLDKYNWPRKPKWKRKKRGSGGR